MARPLRIQLAGGLYHITGRGNERKNIFFTKKDYEKFREYIRSASLRYGFILHCYVLMRNHYHLVGETPKANISAVMHYINTSYTTYINKKRGRSGHLFQGRYKSVLVDRDSYLLELSRYVHLNPVRAGIVEKPDKYLWSSYRAYIDSSRDDIVHRDFIWRMVSPSPEDASARYRTFVEEAIGVSQESPFAHTRGMAILGDQKFAQDVIGRMGGTKIEDKEVALRKELKSPVLMPITVLEVISQAVQVPLAVIVDKKGQYRNLAVYLVKKYTIEPNKDIGRLFGNISYSAISQIAIRFEKRIEADAGLRQTTERIKNLLSNVKG
jgi:REP element-mobilizing transposase RayT